MTFCHVFINISGGLEKPKIKENIPCKKVFLSTVSLYNDLRSKSLLSLVSLGKEVYLFMEINKSIVIERRFTFSEDIVFFALFRFTVGSFREHFAL